MSPVFRHGRLRLYLLKLLDEAPRHGYEVIRLLQDRFMGIYAPSPGTIYPRLARLEEDGLVTHEEVDGKKVYSITDKGREEIRARLGDLADLEDELTESLRDVAREISVDVRDTVRTIREELASAAREFRMQGSGKSDQIKSGKAAGSESASEPAADPSDEASRIREDARRARERMRAEFRSQRRGKADWAGWSAWSEWASGKDWASKDWASKDWAGRDWAGRDWARDKDWGSGWGVGGDATTGRQDTEQDAGPTSRSGSSPFSDLEGLAIQFANELRAAAIQTGNLGERSLTDLRDILTDTLARVRDEVFDAAGSARRAPDADHSPGAGDEPPAPAGHQGSAPDEGKQADQAAADQAAADDRPDEAQ